MLHSLTSISTDPFSNSLFFCQFEGKKVHSPGSKPNQDKPRDTGRLFRQTKNLESELTLDSCEHFESVFFGGYYNLFFRHDSF